MDLKILVPGKTATVHRGLGDAGVQSGNAARKFAGARVCAAQVSPEPHRSVWCDPPAKDASDGAKASGSFMRTIAPL